MHRDTVQPLLYDNALRMPQAAHVGAVAPAPFGVCVHVPTSARPATHVVGQASQRGPDEPAGHTQSHEFAVV